MELDVKELLGKTITTIVVKKNDENEDDNIVFTTSDNKKYKMYHDQNCCEKVNIEDIIGNLEDLIGSPLLMAEEVTSYKNPQDVPLKEQEYGYASYTWTFYKFAAIKGYVTIRWYGESNGYYSEEVDFEEIEL